MAGKKYPFPQIYRMVSGVQQTPIVDGGGLKHTIERQVMQFVEQKIGDQITPKTCLVTSGADRYGMAQSAVDAGYETVFGDLMFGLGLPIPLHTLNTLHWMARVLAPRPEPCSTPAHQFTDSAISRISTPTSSGLYASLPNRCSNLVMVPLMAVTV